MKPRLIAIIVIFTILTAAGVVALRLQMGWAFDTVDTPTAETAKP